MHLDPVIPALCLLTGIVLALAIMLRRLRQPHVVAYIIAGVLLGPSGIGVVQDAEVMARLGAIGVVLLLFFVGLEMDLRSLLARWRIALIGTILQVAVSVGAAWILGTVLQWPVGRMLLMGFVISLSSTAVVLKLLADHGTANSNVGRSVTGILLVQDLIIIPMLITLGFFGADRPTGLDLTMQTLGGALMISLVIGVRKLGRIPIVDTYMAEQSDEEISVLGALLACFGLAVVTGLLGLSAALGAFVAGIVIGSSKKTKWIHGHLAPFRVVFVGAFFVSVGMLIDLRFLLAEWRPTLVLLIAVFATNTCINGAILRFFGESWRDSAYGGALLAQIGELSFVLATLGYKAEMIGTYGYELTMVTIALSLTFSPVWIAIVNRFSQRLSRVSRNE